MSFIESFSNLTLTQWLFYIVSLITLFGALGAIMSKKSIHSLIYLILTIISLSVHFILLSAYFMAFLNTFVYGSGLIILYIIFNSKLKLSLENHQGLSNYKAIGISTLLALVIGLILIAAIRINEFPKVNPYNSLAQSGDFFSITKLLFSKYILPFALLIVIAFMGIFGNFFLNKKTKG